MEARDILRRIPFFAEILDEAQLGRLAQGARQAEYDQNSVLIRERDQGDSLFVVVHGAVTIAIHDSGRDRRVATLRDGDIVGEMSLLTGARRTATVTALRPTVTLEISKSALQPILADAPDLADHFAEMVEKRRAELDELHGTGNWLRPGVSVGEFADRVRQFFASPG